MPEIKRFSIDSSLKEIEDIIKSGVNTVAIFPVIDPDNKDDQGSEAIKSDNFISSTIRKIKEEFPDIPEISVEPGKISKHLTKAGITESSPV